MGVYIRQDGETLLCSVSYSGTYTTADPYRYRRVNGVWEMESNKGEWFACEPCHDTMRAVQDYECCLRSYTFAESVANLERQEKAKREIKDIFAPVKLKYNAAAENRARFNRFYNYARLTKRFMYSDPHFHT